VEARVPQRLEQGRAAFNRGEYFEAHELWEEAWRELEGAERIVVQGLIQIAAGLHHLQQRRPRPGAGLLRKGLAKLSRPTPAALVHLPIDVLARDVARLLTELETPGATAPDLTTFKL
jgi:predicted metal-dependent hydrolase